MSEFSYNDLDVGDIFILEKSILYKDEVGRLQMVTGITPEHINSIFLDNIKPNGFNVDSVYHFNIIITEKIKKTFNNGIPVVWGDDI